MKRLEELPAFYSVVFDGLHAQLLPSVTQIFQLELAWLETQVLDSYQLKERSAFFQTIDEIPTKHYLLFEKNKISTGYAVHDLYPSRARLHPQIVKGILNAVQVARGDVVLDPLCGSGTTNLEAIFLGADSIAVDLNPINRLMTRVKYEVLKLPLETLEQIPDRAQELFETVSDPAKLESIRAMENSEEGTIHYLALLAFLHALRWASNRQSRSASRPPKVSPALFRRALHHYYRIIHTFVTNPEFHPYELGSLQVLPNLDARTLEGIEDESVDVVLTSPPYSLASDYVRSDYPQLQFLGIDVHELREKLIGLTPRNVRERVERYFTDMEQVFGAIARVLKPHKWFVLVIGKPTLREAPADFLDRIQQMVEQQGFRLYRDIPKPIKGTRDEWHEEHILFYRKEGSRSETGVTE